MDVKIKKEEGNKLEFSVEGISLPLANSIRKYTMMHVPIVAIDKVIFYENSSSFFDEYIAHRLGLFPIITPKKIPPDTEVTFSLDAVGPAKIYASDLKSSDSEITIAKDRIPLVELTENQALRLEGKAVVGIGRKHAKFQAAIVGYSIENKTINFKVESCFHMAPRETILRALDVLDDDIDGLMKAIKKGK